MYHRFGSDHWSCVVQSCQVFESIVYRFPFCCKKCTVVYIFVCFIILVETNEVLGRFKKSNSNQWRSDVLSVIGFKGVPAKVNISDKEKLLQYVLFDSFYHRIFLMKRTFHVLVCDFLTVLQNITFWKTTDRIFQSR